ncbi:MAG: 50S ribosomal protein L25 [Holophagales bacterium]|nr:50S ribosomal protein L25 [Holophagales bacterium]
MLQEDVIIEVERRSETGKNACNRLREKDLIPAVLYGGGAGMESMSLSVPRKSLLGLFRKGIHQNVVFLLQLKGTEEKRHVMVRDVTLSPLRRELIHVDFLRILLDRKMKMKVSVEAVGIAAGVKLGGTLDVVTRELEIECLPADIPASIPVDVSALGAGEVLRVADLNVGDKLRILGDTDRVLAHVVMPRAEIAEGAEAAAVAEPEVAKKGKKEEEGAKGAAPKAGAAKAAAPAAAAPKAAEKKGKK